MREFDGQVAIVAGGASGIGRACVQLLAARGANVTFFDRNAVAVSEVTAEQGDTDPVYGIVADVTDDAAVADVVAQAIQRAGRIDILVNAAGIQRYGTTTDTTEDTWDDVFRVNVKSCFLLARHALPHLRESRGAIVLVSSVQAFVAQNNAAAYVTSKAAVNSFARSLAIDEAPHGVRANVVCPGSVDTPMLRESARQFSDGTSDGIEALLATWGGIHPMGRIAQAAEVAEAVAFLAGSRASFITGASLPVDGGLVASVAVAAEKS